MVLEVVCFGWLDWGWVLWMYCFVDLNDLIVSVGIDYICENCIWWGM